MGLLDLPSEIFQPISNMIVDESSVVDSWKLRETCKTFYNYIGYEALAAPHSSAYKDEHSRTIVKQNLGTFFFLRSRNPKQAHEFLPEFIRDMTEEIMEIANDNKYETRLQYTRDLSDVLARSFEHAYYYALEDLWPTNTLYWRRTDYVNTTNVANKVTAAAAVGNLRALKDLTKDDRSRLWARSRVFGYPVEAAALAGHMHVVQALVEQTIADSEVRYASQRLNCHIVINAITVAIAHRHTFIAKYLIQIYQDSFGLPGDTCFEEWLPAAIRAGSTNLLCDLLTMKHRVSYITLYNGFKVTCTNACLDMCRVFFETATLSVDGVYPQLRTFRQPNLTSTYPLATAIAACQPAVVRFLLEDLHADPDGPKYLHADLVGPKYFHAGPNGLKYLHAGPDDHKYLHRGMQVPLAEALSTYAREPALPLLLLQAGANPRKMPKGMWKVLMEYFANQGFYTVKGQLIWGIGCHLAAEEESDELSMRTGKIESRDIGDEEDPENPYVDGVIREKESLTEEACVDGDGDWGDAMGSYEPGAV